MKIRKASRRGEAKSSKITQMETIPEESEGEEEQRHSAERTVDARHASVIAIAGVASCAVCGSRAHRDMECTSKVIHERVLDCSVSSHGLYVFGMADGCPKCNEARVQ